MEGEEAPLHAGGGRRLDAPVPDRLSGLRRIRQHHGRRAGGVDVVQRISARASLEKGRISSKNVGGSLFPSLQNRPPPSGFHPQLISDLTCAFSYLDARAVHAD